MAVTDTEQLSFEHEALTFSAQAMGDGPIVLCLHGFPDNAGSFRHQLPALAEAGYRAISLTLRGMSRVLFRPMVTTPWRRSQPIFWRS